MPILIASLLGLFLLYHLFLSGYLKLFQKIGQNDIHAIVTPLCASLGKMVSEKNSAEMLKAVTELSKKNPFIRYVEIKDVNNHLLFENKKIGTHNLENWIFTTDLIKYNGNTIGSLTIYSDLDQQFPMLKTYFDVLFIGLVGFFSLLLTLLLSAFWQSLQRPLSILINCTKKVINGESFEKSLKTSDGLMHQIEENLLNLSTFTKERNQLLQSLSDSKDIVLSMQEDFINKKDISFIIEDAFPQILASTESEYALVCAVDFSDNAEKTIYNLTVSNDLWWQDVSKQMLKSSTLSNIVFKEKSLIQRVLDAHIIKTETINTEDYQKYHLATPIFSGREIQGILMLARKNMPYAKEIQIDHEVFINALGQVLLAYKNQKKLIHSYAKIKSMAEHDSLTNLFNRNYFETLIDLEIKKTEKTGGFFALLLIDIGEFQKINDFYGHKTGDEVLIMLSQRLKANVKEKDPIARLGSDEFAILLSNIESIEMAKKVIYRLIEKTAHENYTIHEKHIQCSISVGVALYPNSGKTKEDIITHASFALTEAKKNPEKWRYYGEDLASKHLEKMVLEKEIINAIKAKNLYLMYQPQINIKDGSIFGFEALIRWQHPEKNHISPGVFIPVIEKCGLSKITNEYILHHALKNISDFTHTEKSIEISINISPCVERFDQHMASLISIYKQYLIPKNIEIAFEITESGFVDSSDKSIDEFKRGIDLLKENHIKIAIDDFGIEHSSLNRFAQYNFDVLKIDKVFIDDIACNQASAPKAIVKAIINMAKDLEIDIIAEGVETLAQVKKLQDFGAIIAQGFYYHRPLHKDKAIKLLNE